MYRKKAGGWLKHLDFIVLDLLCIQAAFLLAYAVRMGPTSPYRDEAYKEIGIIVLLAEVAVVLLTGAFSGILRRGRYEEFGATDRRVWWRQWSLLGCSRHRPARITPGSSSI